MRKSDDISDLRDVVEIDFRDFTLKKQYPSTLRIILALL